MKLHGRTNIPTPRGRRSTENLLMGTNRSSDNRAGADKTVLAKLVPQTIVAFAPTDAPWRTGVGVIDHDPVAWGLSHS